MNTDPALDTDTQPFFGFIKEVLRREIQGLKVWPVYRSQVFSITGTYF
jgi:hypothetical protein